MKTMRSAFLLLLLASLLLCGMPVRAAAGGQTSVRVGFPIQGRIGL